MLCYTCTFIIIFGLSECALDPYRAREFTKKETIRNLHLSLFIFLLLFDLDFRGPISFIYPKRGFFGGEGLFVSVSLETGSDVGNVRAAGPPVEEI